MPSCATTHSDERAPPADPRAGALGLPPSRRGDRRARALGGPGVSYRPEALADPSFDPGRRLALVPEPDNEHDPNAVAIWNEEQTLQLGYVPRETAPELRGDEQALSLWRVEGGLRVLIVPPGAWVGRPR